MRLLKFENAHCSIINSLLISSTLPSSCTAYVNWIYPRADTSGLIYNYFDTVYFTWTSNITNPWMNLWCAPSSPNIQSQTPAYHAQLSTNGTNPQSFQYPEYVNGLCHMQLEDLSGDDYANTPKGAFSITSNDAVAPQTWGLSALSLLGESTDTTAVASSLSAGPSSTNIATQLLSSSSSLSPSSSPSSSSPSSPLLSPSPTVSFAISAITTVTATAQLPSASSPSKSLSTAAQAGIGIGSTLSGLALIAAILFFYSARSWRTRNEHQRLNGFGPSETDNSQTTAEAGEAVHYEINGVPRPSELQGIPRAELAWTPRMELSSISER